MNLNNLRKALLRLTLSAAAVTFFTACSGRSAEGADVATLTVSIEPQRWMLRQIVGDNFKVNTLLSNGANPESYEPTVSHIASLQRSAAYFCVGNLGFESSVVERVKANNPDLQISVTSDSISLIYDSHNCDGHSHNHVADPHVWSSAQNAKIMARNMARTVCAIDPDNADLYAANLAKLLQRIDSVDQAVKEILAPCTGESFLIWHPSLSYFARDYGLHQLPLSAEGKESSVSATRRLVDRAAATGAHVFFIQKDFDSSQANVVARHGEASLRVVTINPLDYDWASQMLLTARAIAGQ